MGDTFDPGCGAELSFTAAGNPACLQAQLFASAVKYQGSDGAVDGWFADAPEVAAEVLGYLGGPQGEPVEVGDKTLIIVPASEGGSAALDAATGTSERTTDGPRLRQPGHAGQWGGQGARPERGLVARADTERLAFFDAKTGVPVSAHWVGDYAALTSSQRFVVVGGEEKSTMRAVVEK